MPQEDRRRKEKEQASDQEDGGSYERARNAKGAVDRAGGPATGLSRTGKSCRFRWVNYLHPGLKRGHMTPQEERLVLELHSKWGNRWSRIARRLPGRTDNEIKNYWRTHVRKMAQERTRNSSTPSASSSSSSLLSLSESPPEAGVAGNVAQGTLSTTGFGEDEGLKVYPMDQIWNEIDTSESVSGLSFEEYKDEACNVSCPPLPSPMWDESLWKMDDHEEFNMTAPMGELLVSNYHHGREYSLELWPSLSNVIHDCEMVKDQRLY